jgi:hypothetical protein
MLTLITSFLASANPAPVPDSGSSALLFSCGVAVTGVALHFVKKLRK